MDEEELETPAAEENEEIEIDLEDEPEEETVDELRAKLAAEAEARQKAEQAFADQQKRAEKAEKTAKAPKKDSAELSTTDLYALMQAQVPQEDISEIADYAKMKNISVAEALKSNVVKTILSDSAELRRTAEATSAGPSRRGQSGSTGESLLAAARSGKMPESEEDMRKLIDARLKKS